MKLLLSIDKTIFLFITTRGEYLETAMWAWSTYVARHLQSRTWYANLRNGHKPVFFAACHVQFAK